MIVHAPAGGPGRFQEHQPPNSDVTCRLPRPTRAYLRRSLDSDLQGLSMHQPFEIPAPSRIRMSAYNVQAAPTALLFVIFIRDMRVLVARGNLEKEPSRTRPDDPSNFCQLPTFSLSKSSAPRHGLRAPDYLYESPAVH